MHFRLSTLFLLIVIAGLAIGWYVDRIQLDETGTDYFATIQRPSENDVYSTNTAIQVDGLFLDVMSRKQAASHEPIVIVELLYANNNSLVICHTGFAKVTQIEGQPGKFQLTHTIPANPNFLPRQYLIQMRCIVNGEFVVTPSRFIELVDAPLRSK